MSRFIPFAILLLVASQSTANEFFEKHIRPVLVQKCYRCHGPESKKRGGLSLATRADALKGGSLGPSIVPGKPSKSLLIDAINHRKDLEMPPSKKLTAREIDLFTAWVKSGAPWPKSDVVQRPDSATDFWAFQPPKPVTSPKVKQSDWPLSPMDRFILEQLESRGLTPSKRATKATLIRRATLDLHGIPPTLAEVDAFLKDDSPSAFARVVDRLLSSPRFGERWGRHWLDVARFAESAGQSRNVSFRFAWRYRNRVIDLLNADVPYDRFILEQIAGDLLPAKSKAQQDQQHISTGFLLVGPKLLNERTGSLIYRMGVVDDQIDTTFRAFMGLTVGCARCHDHKYDPIPARDYYAIAGIFRSCDNLCGVEANTNTDDAGLYPLGEGGEKLLAEIERRKQMFVDARKTYLDAKRAKEKLEAQLRTLKKKGISKEEEDKRQKEIKVAFEKMKVELRKFVKARQSIPKPPPSAMAVREGKKVDDCELFLRGDVRKPSKKVPRGAIQILTKTVPFEKIQPKQSGRMQLAKWLADRRNPLTARVRVNRIWHHLFGRGLVPTPDNFGRLGQPPSHPQLLDHLAVDFMKDWSTKRLIRRIMLSCVYQQSSQHRAKAYRLDPDNALLWRMSRRRMEGEAIRDSLLYVARNLDLQQFRGSIISELGMFEMGQKYQGQLRASYQKASYRSVYLPMMRAALPDLLMVFDAPDSSLVRGQRDITTVASQALLMLNDDLVIQQAKALVKRIVREQGDESRARLAFRLTLCREPSETELRRILRFVESSSEQDWLDVCHVLLASAEFRTIY